MKFGSFKVIMDRLAEIRHSSVLNTKIIIKDFLIHLESKQRFKLDEQEQFKKIFNEYHGIHAEVNDYIIKICVHE